MNTRFERGVTFASGHARTCRYRNLQNLPHWHREHELVLVENGTAAVMADGNLFTLQAGESIFLHSEALHSIRAEAGGVVTVVKIDAEHFRRLFDKKRLQSPLLSSKLDVAGVLGRLLDEQRQSDTYSGRAIDSLTTGLLIAILRGHPLTERAPESDTAETYKALLDHIASNYAYITFDEAAHFMHFSRPYFSKYFLHHAGMTFTRYLNMIRVSAAAERVLEGKQTVTEIARSCGFNTIRSFNRVFKELTGYAPCNLPADHNLIRDLRYRTDNSFDPTLNCTEVLV